MKIQCKMCGDVMIVSQGATIATCESCGTTQTIAKIDDAKKISLIDRANALRLNNNFDKALATYENVLVEYPKEAEVYWGICLCKYGIEYVDDPKTGNKIPTCHRASYDSIFDDIDYINTIKFSDEISKNIYKEEAKKINEIQRQILAISQREKPFDIFICYKETDDKGHRTEDSVIAQDIYEKLVQKGYRVFFSRITLETKLGIEYEPYIFAALNSAKVMLVLGTKLEYMDSPWVRNEWSRFRRLMSSDHTKHLIPCYKNIEINEMPKEFRGTQSQDLTKIGYHQDLLRGIEKLIDLKERVKNQTKINRKTDLIEKAITLIKDKEYVKAQKVIEDMLCSNDKDGDAYVLKLLLKNKIVDINELKYLNKSLDNDSDYKNALKFVGEKKKEELIKINAVIKKRVINVNKKKKFSKAKMLFNNGHISEALSYFEACKEIEDAKEYIERCESWIKEDNYNQALELIRIGNYKQAIELLNENLDYKDSKKRVENSLEKHNTKMLNIEKNRLQEAIKTIKDDNSLNLKKLKEMLALTRRIENEIDVCAIKEFIVEKINKINLI